MGKQFIITLTATSCITDIIILCEKIIEKNVDFVGTILQKILSYYQNSQTTLDEMNQRLT